MEGMIRPVTSESDVASRIARLYPVEVLKIKQLEGYDDLNFYLECRSEDDDVIHKYVCKVVNNIDSQKFDIIEVQYRLMEHLCKIGITVPEPVPNNWLQYYSLETFGDTKHMIRLLTYVNGCKLNDCLPCAELYLNVGKFTGRIYSVLKGYKEDSLKDRKHQWMLESVPNLHKFLMSVTNPEHRELARTVMQDFEDRVVPEMPELEKGVMHGDINEHNILVDNVTVVGLIDFGDVCWGPVIFEIALCLAYMCIHSNDISTGKHVLSGYQNYRPLTTTERKIIKAKNLPPNQVMSLGRTLTHFIENDPLMHNRVNKKQMLLCVKQRLIGEKICVCARLAQSLVLGCHAAQGNPNNIYILSSQKNGWPLLSQLLALDDLQLGDLWGLKE